MTGRKVPEQLQQQAVGGAVLGVQGAGAVDFLFRVLAAGVLREQAGIAALEHRRESGAGLLIGIGGRCAQAEVSIAIGLQVIARFLAGQDDRAADGVGAVQHRSGSANQFDPLDVVGVDAVPAVSRGAGLEDVVAANAVDDGQHPVAAHSANAESFVASPARGAHRYAGLKAHEVVEVFGHLALDLLCSDQRNGAGDVLYGARQAGGGDDQLFDAVGVFLRRDRRRQRQGDARPRQTTCYCGQSAGPHVLRGHLSFVHDSSHYNSRWPNWHSDSNAKGRIRELPSDVNTNDKDSHLPL